MVHPTHTPPRGPVSALRPYCPLTAPSLPTDTLSWHTSLCFGGMQGRARGLKPRASSPRSAYPRSFVPGALAPLPSGRSMTVLHPGGGESQRSLEKGTLVPVPRGTPLMLYSDLHLPFCCHKSEWAQEGRSRPGWGAGYWHQYYSLSSLKTHPSPPQHLPLSPYPCTNSRGLFQRLLAFGHICSPLTACDILQPRTAHVLAAEQAVRLGHQPTAYTWNRLGSFPFMSCPFRQCSDFKLVRVSNFHTEAP